MAKNFDLGNGHTLIITEAHRGLTDDYEVQFLEDGRSLFHPEYMSRDAIEEQYGISI